MDGFVTRRNIEKGEVIITGTMNNPGTVLMTISDMSIIEAVLEVDQTDVPQLRIGQKADVRIDAFPDQKFPGEVSEIGSSPIQGTSALGGAATGTDYTVKVTLLKHPERIRPGLTVTADITTAAKTNTLTVPIGALVLRQPDTKGTPTPAPAADATPGSTSVKKESVASRAREIEGVYVVAARKVEFRPVTTGIRGELDVEIVDGLKEGDEMVIGPFRALRDLKPGAQVVVDNTPGGGPQG
jgi:HlyD family secretion protein